MQQHNGPILAIDFGTKMIGSAISDADCMMALPLRAFKVGKKGVPFEEIAKTAHEREVKQIVIGLALNEDFSESTMSAKARDFGENLEEHTDIDITFSDEYLSTFTADSLLADKKRMSKEDRDILAATVILTAYLEKNFR